MISFVRKITVNFLSYALIAVMGLLITNKALYNHSHILVNGKVYTHAHPYNKTNDSKPFKSHHHTKAEFLFFQSLDLLFFSLFLIFFSSFVFKSLHSNCYVEKTYIKFFLSTNLGRAPPRS